ncbi:LPXTG cell wall anchor domain-containing protein [Natronosporangium hydrolyticum]|uniref:LPXTG cell wall anchor domain-containing protein n=1 Tax=Natronosporangium hydrolyticum TaxID=2811111 RepID=A0A895YBA4_9ACTN|nr:LPXTG cell wall anchor domain-containing protein [Natronosporangium hydrolyticum]
MKNPSLTRRLIAGAAGVAIGTVGALAFTIPAQAVVDEPVEPSVEFENTCDGTLVTLHSGTDQDVYEWVIGHDGGEGGTREDVPAGQSATVLAPWQWDELAVTYTGSPEGWTQTWSWTAPADCEERPELPEEIGSWGFDCQQVEVVLTNTFPADEFGDVVTFTVETSAGETSQADIAVGDTATLHVASAENLEIWILGNDLPITDRIEITSEEWAATGCTADGDEAGGEGGEDELPLTGASTALIAAGAVALLALGAVLFVVARRRRVNFTA